MAYKASSNNAASSNAPSVPVPAGAAAGDIAVIVLASDDTGWNLSQAGGRWPTGFNVVMDADVTTDGESIGAAWKRLAGADSGSYSFGTMASGNEWAAACALWDGRSASDDPVASTVASSSAGNTSPVTATANGVTAVAGDDLAYIVGHDVAGTALAYNGSTAPTNFTSRQDVELSPFGWASVFIASRDNVTAGATGSIAGTFALSADTAGWAAVVLRIPVAGVPADNTPKGGSAGMYGNLLVEEWF